ncbi:hypothetical protein BD779DRAFT_1667739 [Infundibulicybe gibba]|nr:hypothetical protein BD779DRAFT_1667739 [Infundibulicybe gibba]
MSQPTDHPSSKPQSSHKPQNCNVNQQPSPTTLAKDGIKVRDFAYESTLPPIAPWRSPQWRAKQEDESQGQGEPSKKAKLERQVTEPAIEVLNPPTRARGFFDLAECNPSEDLIINSQPIPQSFRVVPPTFDSQDTDVYINTPLVTPNGSFQSPMKGVSPEESPAPEMSYQRLKLAQVSSRLCSSRDSSPLSSLPSSLPLIPSPPVAGPSNPKFLPLSKTPRNIPLSRTVSPRYHFRKRPTAPLAISSPTKPRARRTLKPPTHPPPRPIAISVQASHSRSRGDGPKPSRTRTLRKRTAINSKQESKNTS